MAKKTNTADQLIKELQTTLKLSEADAARASFCVIALSRDWPKAKIGRYLGISRSRVGQKVEKYEQYAEDDRFPVLQSYMSQIGQSKQTESAALAGYSRKDWEDPKFAGKMLEKLED
jgi:hypothetical protein